jgi:hypothetical protein
MGWLGRWIGAWAGRWLGYEPEQQQDGSAPYTRYRAHFQPEHRQAIRLPGRQLAVQISSGRRHTAARDTDDYVRFRVPDTNCPILPEPIVHWIPALPTKPNRTAGSMAGSMSAGTGWRFGATAGQALDWVQLSIYML